ncbi:hypothetical protein ACF0H5_006640 [Mactra antiquata]
MQFDLLFEELGEYGCFQRWIVWSISTVSFWGGLLSLTSVFVLAIPKHRCAIPGWDNDTFTIQNDQHQAIINNTIPLSNTDDELLYDQCHYYNVDHHGNRTLEQCSTWVYDMSIYKTSLAADLNMVCDGAIMKSNAQMASLAGILVGSIITGLISDRYGRKITMCVSLSITLVCSLGMVWSSNYILYVILTFLVGFFTCGSGMSSFVIALEYVGPSQRKFAGILGSIMYTLGFMALPALAYLIKEWSKLLLVVSLVGVVFIPLWLKCLCPESARWLLARGRYKEAREVIEMWAKWNKVTLSENVYKKIMTETEDEESKESQGNLLNLFTSRVLFIRTAINFLIWAVTGCSYYGLAFNAEDLGTDLYLNISLQAAVELPSNFLCIFLLDRIGRKPITLWSMIIGGVALVGTIFTLIYLPDSLVATTVIMLIGKFGVSVCYSTIFVYSAELFPTVVRSVALGACTVMSTFGGMVAPYLADLDRFIGGQLGKAIPQVIFATIIIAGGITAIFLPETLDRDLPETFEDAKVFGKYIQKKRPEEYNDDDIEQSQNEALVNDDTRRSLCLETD